MQPGSPLQAGTWARTRRSCAFHAFAVPHLYESVIEPRSRPVTFVTEDLKCCLQERTDVSLARLKQQIHFAFLESYVFPAAISCPRLHIFDCGLCSNVL